MSRGAPDGVRDAARRVARPIARDAAARRFRYCCLSSDFRRRFMIFFAVMPGYFRLLKTRPREASSASTAPRVIRAAGAERFFQAPYALIFCAPPLDSRHVTVAQQEKHQARRVRHTTCPSAYFAFACLILQIFASPSAPYHLSATMRHAAAFATRLCAISWLQITPSPAARLPPFACLYAL